MTSSFQRSYKPFIQALLSQGAWSRLASVRSAVLLVCAMLVAGSVRVGAESKAPAAPPSEGSRAIAAQGMKLDMSGLSLAIGDKIKIMFLERIGGGAGDNSPQSMNVVERVELTGDYTLQLDGNIYLPVLGSQKIAGLGLTEVQTHLQASFQDMFGKEARVSLSIIEREPVYVFGKVARPGTYEYTPGMTVLHALARAGGTQNAERSDIYESVRETQRLEQALEKQKRIQARLDVLKAERDTMPAVPSEKLKELAGNTQAAQLVSEIASLRKLAQETRSFRLLGLESTIKAATRELTNQRERIELIKSNSANKSERVAMLKQLSTRGTGNTYNYLQAKSDVSDTQERLSEVQSLIAQIEDRLAQAQHELSRIIIEARIDLELEFRS